MNCLKKDYLDRVKHVILIVTFINYLNLLYLTELNCLQKNQNLLCFIHQNINKKKDKLTKLLGSYPIYKGYNPFLFNFKKFI